jgi:hypothetical protein
MASTMLSTFVGSAKPFAAKGPATKGTVSAAEGWGDTLCQA